MKNPADFSLREKEVVELLLKGLSNKQIARALRISESTVEFHLTNIYRKLGVSSRTEAVLNLERLWKTRAKGGALPFKEDGTLAREKLWESPGEKDGFWVDNQGEESFSTLEVPDMPNRPKSFLAKFKLPLAVGTLIVLAIVVAGVLLRPGRTNLYERERE